MTLKPRGGIKSRGIKRKPRQNPTRGKKRANKPLSISKLIKTADALFSAKARRIGAWEQDGELWNKCYTSGYKAPIRKLHCGHYLSRYYKSARWDFDNARPQSMMDNMWKRGDPVRFRENLIREIGEARVLAVERKRGVSLKLTREYLTDLIYSLKQSLL
ncbi:MAG: hypothetical protein DDT19_01192 [Syntrophomonadaceae bacterium]|nr:hypothetical protein [Bacillota bacterium]